MARKDRIKPEALVVAYALSRLGKTMHTEFGWKTWKQAFRATSTALDEGENSIRLLRDEFDPFFENGRQGWWKRAPHHNRVAVLREFESVSDAALIETVRLILRHDVTPLQEVFEAVEAPATRVAGVAERLLTGRLAEEFFLDTCDSILDLRRSLIVDRRQDACGFDFGVSSRPEIAIEVKGMKTARGSVLFTDREWREALSRRSEYWLVTIGCLPSAPRAGVTPDPTKALPHTFRTAPSVRVEWTAQVSV